jgi:MFS family permease
LVRIDSIKGSNRNFYAFIWHALFLAAVSTFIDVNTVLSSVILNIGGSSTHVGILTAISIGIPLMAQLLFAGFLAGRPRKKPWLLMGIALRVLALAGMGFTLSMTAVPESMVILPMIFLWIGLFSLSGAFAGISYTDILGKVLVGSQRRRFLVFKQLIASVVMLLSAIIVRHLVTAFSYPQNYTILFLMASGLLSVAALGFFAVEEKSSPVSKSTSMIRTIRAIPTMLRTDSNLVNYIVSINLASLGLTIIPFYVALSKSAIGLTRQQTGDFLLLIFVGMILSTPIWNWVALRYKYKGIALSSVLIGGLLPVTALILLKFGIDAYRWVFFLSGFVIASSKISFEGILLEITNVENRAIYAGISGTLSLTAAFFPIIAGVLIEIIGFHVIFVITAPLVLASIFFILRLNCETVR